MKTLNDRPWLILGAGGHAAVVIDALQRAGATVSGVLDPAWQGAAPLQGVPMLGADDHLETVNPKQVYIAVGVGGNGGNPVRRSLFTRARNAGFELPPVIHPDSTVAESASLEPGVQVMAGAVIQARALLGEGVIVNTLASVDHDSAIGAFCHIAPHACICGGVKLGQGVHVGAGAVVIQEIEVMADSFIKAGSCLTRSLTR
ncbi:NeuD/PglB/VioB family sugar acetyltransferase [Saccharospirillum alexandrii]|uniref:NeuD/PglB/VioB family sugar acetyltransferase n=1 Tax=Saccharospirillum alexandrii TaxID=2448477 RepID=UPI0037357CF4